MRSIAFVGVGAISSAYSAAIAQVPQFRLRAVVDNDPAARDRAAAAHAVPGFASVEDLLEADRPDAVVLMTPPSTHEELAVSLLGRGVDVLCEKPLAIGAESAERMQRAAADSGRTLMMASKFRYVPDVEKAAQLLTDGLIGDLLLFENAFCSRVDMSRRWNSVPAVSGGGVLIDNGTHSLDIARRICGPLARIQAQIGRNVQPIEVDDTARILFETETGAMGAVDLSWSLTKDVTSFVRLYGSRGTIEVGWKRSRYRIDGSPEWIEFGPGYDKVGAFRSQLENFAGTIRGTEAPKITVEDALWSVRAIDAAYRSASANKWIPIG
jgi:predicted dehydrogenase